MRIAHRKNPRRGKVLIALAALSCGVWAAAPAARAQATRPSGSATTEPVVASVARPSKIMDISVGESRYLDAAWPVKKVSVADPSVADVDAVSPTRIQIRGKALGMTELVLEGEQGESWHARIAVNADTSRLQNEFHKLFPDSNIEVAQVDQVIVVKGTFAHTEDAAQLRQLLKIAKIPYLDLTSVAGVQQVQLQVKIAEVSRSAIRMLGVNAFYGGNQWFGGLQLGSAAGPFIPMNVGLPPSVPVSPVPPFAYQTNSTGIMNQPAATLFAGFPHSDLQVFVQALEENQYLRILAEPTLVARSGHKAQFLVGGEIPLPISQLNGGETQISIEYKDYGIRLQFTPTVLGDGRIELEVLPEISELSDVGSINVLGTTIPGLLTRRVETTLDLHSGQTFAIAGLINQSDNARISKVPGFGDLPILGALFRSTRYNRDDTEMLVLVTASLVTPTSNDLSPPAPGAFHEQPSDWELFIDGRTGGHGHQKMAPEQKEHLRKLGLDRLKGPGAWASYDKVPDDLAAEKDNKAK